MTKTNVEINFLMCVHTLILNLSVYGTVCVQEFGGGGGVNNWNSMLSSISEH